MLTCIILNYNDSDSVLKLYNHIKDYTIFDHIVIVDGASTDNSYQQLKKLSNHKTTVLLADKNGGYGYGNNIGLRYSQEIGATHSVIANPDVRFDEKVIVNCLKVFEDYSLAVAIAPKVEKGRPAFKFASSMLDITLNSILLNKIFKPRYYSNDYFKNKELIKVDVLPGSLVIFDLKKFGECGFYDERVFLYNEEIIIGRKFQKKGYISLLNKNVCYQHFHSVSVKKTFKSVKKIKEINIKSHMFYLKEYMHTSKSILFLYKLIIPFIYLELFIWTNLKKNIKKLYCHD